MKDLIKKILREEVVDINDIQDELLTMPLVARQKLLDDLTDVVSVDEEYINMDEQISYKGIPEIKAKTTVGKILKWVKRYITDKATNFLINASMGEIKDTINLLKVMDPTDTTAIFTPKAMYLGGGIDFAKDALSWREQVEEFFGPNNVVKDERLFKLVNTGEFSLDGLSTPALLNPLRAETVRDEDNEFQELFKKWKSNELSPEDFQVFQEKIRENIVHQDLYMLQVCDTNLINFDGTAGAGTFGEAQISALKNQQVFLWLTNGMKLSNVSPWLIPSITKVLVDDELWPFLENFK
jgi:hypothetical protein